MSRTLRRPMFRGGKIDSRGSGITSGLADGGRVGYNQAGLVAPLYSASGPIKSGAEIKRDVVPGIFGLKFDKPFLSMKTPENRIGGVKLDFGQSPKDLGLKIFLKSFKPDIEKIRGLLKPYLPSGFNSP